MVSLDNSQEILEQFLRRELTQASAVDALLELLRAHKQTEGPRPALGFRKPYSLTLSPADHDRIDALLAEIDRRLALM